MKIGFLGAGKMAEAMIGGILKAGVADRRHVVASDVSVERRRAMKKRYSIAVMADNKGIPALSDVIFLAVKPQQMDEALRDIAPAITSRHLVISIAAGRRISSIRRLLPKARIIRVMPNLPCLVSAGMSVLCADRRVTRKDIAVATRLLASFGKVSQLPERTFDAVTALSGSGPAFLAYVLDGMTEAAVSEGLARGDALLLAKQTMFGTAKLLIEKNLDPANLITSVASAKGTTAAGLAVLDKSSMNRVIGQTIHAAALRSKELSV